VHGCSHNWSASTVDNCFNTCMGSGQDLAMGRVSFSRAMVVTAWSHSDCRVFFILAFGYNSLETTPARS